MNHEPAEPTPHEVVWTQTKAIITRNWTAKSVCQSVIRLRQDLPSLELGGCSEATPPKLPALA